MKSIFEAPEEYAADAIRITDDIWFVGNREVSSHLIDTGSGLILIDTCFPETADMLVMSVRSAGFDPADIKYILHTHAHYDHIGATAMLADKYGCRTFIGKKDAFILSERPELTWHAEYGVPPCPDFAPDVLISDGDEICLGRTCVQCIASPGHTPGNMTYIWNTSWKGERYTAALTGGFYPNTAASDYMKKYGLEGWREGFGYTFDRLCRLAPDITLGAHPSFNSTFEKAALLGGAENPFIDPWEWGRYIENGRSFFEEFCLNDPL